LIGDTATTNEVVITEFHLWQSLCIFIFVFCFFYCDLRGSVGLAHSWDSAKIFFLTQYTVRCRPTALKKIMAGIEMVPYTMAQSLKRAGTI